MNEIGPHVLRYSAPWSEEGEIIVMMSLDGNFRISLGGEDFIEEKRGRATTTSNWFNKTIQLQADNDIQLIMWLVQTSDIYVRKICKDNGVEIYRYEPGDIEATGSIYKP
ncbi:MAG: hypothetical protein INR64_01550 [Caulobacteraceae bacterium]|nr:hypothetical protein [Caulobacter sp.]